RAEIVDRNGRVLATSVDADTIYAVPTEVGDPAAAARALCKALGDCDAKDRQALTDRMQNGKAFAYVRRQASPEQARRVADLGLDGIGFIKENRRFYPNRSLAAHLLGYVGIDNLGLAGIESVYDSLIRGQKGKVLVQVDARKQAFLRVERPPTTGATLELTIDQNIQHIVERELKAGVDWANAAGGSAVVMDPTTGEVLAMASYPTFNPNVYRDSKETERRNRPVQDLYEPGSTFKIITASAALEEHVVKPTDLVDVSTGTINFGSRVIRDDHHYGVLTFQQVVEKSSNVGSIKVGLRLGSERFGDYVRRFGFGRMLSPDFRGENAGILWDWSTMTDSAFATTLIGYQVGVTPLQMVTAVSAVANGGELIQPRIVRAVVKDGVRLPVPRKVLGRAISKDTAARLTPMLEGVVTDGTGKQAAVDDYTIAGKTGTAKKVVNGSYKGHSNYNVSFVGFAPSRKPKFTVIVVVDSPHGVPAYGGTVAAPIFQRITDQALRYYGVQKTLNAPPALIVERHPPNANAPLPASGPAEPPRVLNATATADPVVPDLTGMSGRDAVRTLAILGLPVQVVGHGLVTDQRPLPGTPVVAVVSARVWLDRRTPEAVPKALAQ
ncbi:MAG TPA: penicillin-binding transpeptidase domain-containing protein, partial [Vicinamibacterales bacterium]|nr:penicillin-binding transpeptidase domain-containing protein [Vicinamibacterales bacterium]